MIANIVMVGHSHNSGEIQRWLMRTAFESACRFDPAKDDYTGHLAAVKILDLPTWTPGKFDEWFSFIARAHAAPGLVARRLLSSPYGGDDDDKARFKKLCDQLSQDPKVKIDFDWWWNHGLEMAAGDLEKPEAMKSILQVAETLRTQFGL